MGGEGDLEQENCLVTIRDTEGGDEEGGRDMESDRVEGRKVREC